MKILRFCFLSKCVMAILLAMIGSSPVSAAPAPAISSLEIAYVRSPAVQGGNWQSVDASNVQTRDNHGGAYIDVAVRCIGYANGQGAVMSTFPMTYLGSERILDNRGNVIGYYYVYRITRLQDGNVSVWATSINNGRRWTDALYVK